MFRTNRRYLIFFVSSALPIASLALGIYFKISSPSYKALGAAVVGVAILSSISAYYTHIKPFLELGSAVVVLLDSVGQRILDAAADEHIEARLNYLTIYRPMKTLLLCRYFKVVWGLGMKYEPDNTVKFHISKGVAGVVLRDRKSLLVNMEVPKNRNFGFSSAEKMQFPGFTAIWSIPIFELDKAGNATGKILGTINLDSTTRGAASAFRDNPEYERLLDELQDLVSKVASC